MTKSFFRGRTDALPFHFPHQFSVQLPSTCWPFEKASKTISLVCWLVSVQEAHPWKLLAIFEAAAAVKPRALKDSLSSAFLKCYSHSIAVKDATRAAFVISQLFPISERKSTQNITPCTPFEDVAVGLLAGPFHGHFKANLPRANNNVLQRCVEFQKSNHSCWARHTWTNTHPEGGQREKTTSGGE